MQNVPEEFECWTVDLCELAAIIAPFQHVVASIRIDYVRFGKVSNEKIIVV